MVLDQCDGKVFANFLEVLDFEVDNRAPDLVTEERNFNRVAVEHPKLPIHNDASGVHFAFVDAEIAVKKRERRRNFF